MVFCGWHGLQRQFIFFSWPPMTPHSVNRQGWKPLKYLTTRDSELTASLKPIIFWGLAWPKWSAQLLEGEAGTGLSTWRWLRSRWANWFSYYRPSHYHLDIIVIFGGVFSSLLLLRPPANRGGAELLYYIYAQRRRSKSIFGYATWQLVSTGTGHLPFCGLLFFWNEQNLRYDNTQKEEPRQVIKTCAVWLSEIGGK